MAAATRSPFHALLRESFISRPRARNRCSRVRAKMSDSVAKRANLCARKNERIKLPNHVHDAIAEFFNRPCGIEAILNTRALQSYQSLDSNLYSLDNEPHKMGIDRAEQFLDVDVKLNLVLEIYTWSLTLLPVSAVEGPGNKMMQALVDKLVPLLVQQLVQDYEEWIHQECKRLR